MGKVWFYGKIVVRAVASQQQNVVQIQVGLSLHVFICLCFLLELWFPLTVQLHAYLGQSDTPNGVCACVQGVLSALPESVL